MYLGIDQGTTGTTAVLLNSKGKLIGRFTSAVPQHFPKPGWVEHDPNEIWRSVAKSVSGVLKASRIDPKKISGIGITNQRETVSLFENTKPLHRFIVWQDRRTTNLCEKLLPYESHIRKISGLALDPYFSASKILWLRKYLSLSSRNSIRFKTIESYLFEKMTGADVTEATNASRTSLMNLRTVSWSDDLFDIFEIPRSWAPEIIPSQGFHFKTKDLGFLPSGIPVVASLGDQQAALFGQMGWERGAGKMTYGTGSFVLINTGSKFISSKGGAISTLAIQWSKNRSQFALEGSAFNSGSWIQWLRDQLGIIAKNSDSEKKAASESRGVYIIPALTGLAAPFWNPNARGAIFGLTRGIGKAEILRASLEALAFQNRALIEAMTRSMGQKKFSWRVDGGASRNNLLMNIQSSIINSPLQRPKNLEATASGVALLAAYSLKALNLNEIKRTWELDRVFKPNKALHLTYSKNYQHWFDLAKNLR